MQISNDGGANQQKGVENPGALIAIILGLLIGIPIAYSYFNKPATTPMSGDATAQVSVVDTSTVSPDQLSIGSKLWVVYTEELLDEEDARIVRLNELIAAVADRYQEPEETVASYVVHIAQQINKETGEIENLEDTLDASLVAVMQYDKPVKLNSVLAMYAVARTSGSSADTAKRVTYALLRPNEKAIEEFEKNSQQ